MAQIQWGTKTPGHIIYLIDQSGSMSGANEQKAAESITSAMIETLKGCIQGKEVRNRVYITIIGYGNEDGVSIVKEGWIADFVNDLQLCKKNSSTIIPAKSYGMTPMAEAFALANKCITTWLSQRESVQGDYKIPAPIVINITDGYPDDVNEATIEAQKVMNIVTRDDGNVLVFNIHMDDSVDQVEVKFPTTKSLLNGVIEGEFLYDISSEMTPDFIKAAQAQKFEGIVPGSKGFVVNAKGDTLVRFVTFGSGVSQH